MKLKSWIQDAAEQLLQGLVSTFPLLKDNLRYAIHMSHGSVFVYFESVDRIVVRDLVARTEKNFFKKIGLREEDWKPVVSSLGGFWTYYAARTDGFSGTVKFGWCYKESAFFEERDVGKVFWDKLFAEAEELVEE